MTLALSFSLYQREDLRTGIHKFCLGHHNYASKKLLKARVDQHQGISVRIGSHTLANSTYVSVPDQVSFPETLAMVRSVDTNLKVFLYTLMGRYHPTTHGMYSFAKAVMERETELEEYSLQDQGLNPNLPALLT